jgi:hypothetical protein
LSPFSIISIDIIHYAWPGVKLFLFDCLLRSSRDAGPEEMGDLVGCPWGNRLLCAYRGLLLCREA